MMEGVNYYKLKLGLMKVESAKEIAEYFDIEKHPEVVNDTAYFFIVFETGTRSEEDFWYVCTVLRKILREVLDMKVKYTAFYEEEKSKEADIPEYLTQEYRMDYLRFYRKFIYNIFFVLDKEYRISFGEIEDEEAEEIQKIFNEMIKNKEV